MPTSICKSISFRYATTSYATSIFCAVTRCCFSVAEASTHTLLDAFSAANFMLLASFICFIRSSSASVQSLRGFMKLNSEQLALAANFWWPTFANGAAIAAEDSRTAQSIDVSKINR